VTNSKTNKRLYITVAIIVSVAVVGLFLINTGRATADVVKPVAATADEVVTAETGLAQTVVPSLLKMASALIVVVFCIYGSVFLLKKGFGRKLSHNRRNNALELLETTYVGPKKSISLLRVGDKSVLVGVTDNQISVLTELDAEATQAVLVCDREEAQPAKFKDLLTTASQKVRDFTVKGKRTAIETQV
jgi:flagellar biosynthetic protein FliO